MEDRIIVSSKEKEDVFIKRGHSENRPLYPAINSGTIFATDGLVIFFRFTEEHLVRISTKACQRVPRMNITFDTKTRSIYSGRITEDTKMVVALFCGIMYSGLYDSTKNTEFRKRATVSNTKKGQIKKSRSKKSLSGDKTPWASSGQSPHTGTKKFTRPESQVTVKGYMRTLKDGRTIFVRPYSRYLDRPENADSKEYTV